MDLPLPIIILAIPALLFALTIHEFAHGWAALLCGDSTARDSGRLTLNPIAHLDPLGSLMMIGTLIWRFIPFGWAKPVPVDPSKFRNFRFGLLTVSLAGPLSNVLCALPAGILWRNLDRFGLAGMGQGYLATFLQLLFEINLGLSFFNLLPVPPLDGSKVLMAMLPRKALYSFVNYSRHLAIVFIVLLFLEKSYGIHTISRVLYPLWGIYSHFWQAVALI